MTTSDTQVQPVVDSTTTAPKGFTEALGVLATVATFCTAVFGKDWGLSTLTTQISAAGPIVLPGMIALYRLGKHKVQGQIKVAALTPAPAATLTTRKR